MTFLKTVAAIGGTFLALTLSAGAQTVPSPEQIRDKMSRNMIRMVDSGVEQAIERFAQQMYSVDPSGDINAATLERYDALRLAERRARQLSELMKYDLDFDGTLDGEEQSVARAASTASGRSGVRFALLVARADADANGVLAYPEILEAVRQSETAEKLRASGRNNMKEYLVFDANGDGTATLSEMILLVEQQRR